MKNGAENMIETIGHHGRDKKLLVEAQQMLADSKAKIEFLRLRIIKVRQNRQLKQASEENGDGKQRMETTLEERVEELLHRLRIEAAVVAGAKNVIRILQNNKVPDKKQLQAVSFSIYLFFILNLDSTLCVAYHCSNPRDTFFSMLFECLLNNVFFALIFSVYFGICPSVYIYWCIIRLNFKIP